MFRRLLAICFFAGVASVAGNAQLADPMRPAMRSPQAAAGVAAPVRLAGIVIANSRKLALIDGEFLEEGQRIHGVRIVRIERETVTVSRDGQIFVLRPESAVPESAADSGESE